MRAFSAGGIVYRLIANGSPPASDGGATRGDPYAGIEIALVGRLNPAIWVLPKGTPHPGELAADAAVREVREETGLITRIVGQAGSIYYTFMRKGIDFRKEVFHYLLEATGGDVALHDAEHDEARWFVAREALGRLTYSNEAELLQRALDMIASRRAGLLLPEQECTGPCPATAGGGHER
jgi:8-oxo-dGTP pyrophosphatase MutT (NUDIX family)